MKLRKIKKIALISIIMFSLVMSIINISNAAQTVGNITFKAISNTDSNPVANLEINVYQIAIVQNGNFSFTNAFKNAEIDISDFTQANFDKIRDYAIANATPICTKTTDSEGKFVLSNTSLGIYLFVQSGSKDRVEMQTIMVNLPEAFDNNPINYNVIAKPKIVNVPQNNINQGPGDSTASVIGNNLPYTGMLNWPIPVLVITAIVLFCIGWLKSFTNSKKKVN